MGSALSGRRKAEDGKLAQAPSLAVASSGLKGSSGSAASPETRDPGESRFVMCSRDRLRPDRKYPRRIDLDQSAPLPLEENSCARNDCRLGVHCEWRRGYGGNAPPLSALPFGPVFPRNRRVVCWSIREATHRSKPFVSGTAFGAEAALPENSNIAVTRPLNAWLTMLAYPPANYGISRAKDLDQPTSCYAE
jgi:hypothetical protein